MATYALADLHGYLDLYKQVKDFIKPDDKVFYLGDAGDRGPQPWKTIKAILDDEQFIYVMGNHDDMLIEAMIEYFDGTGGEWKYNLACNGGGLTFKEALIDPKGLDYVIKLSKCPLQQRYTSKSGKEVFLSHAGFTPGKDPDFLWDRKHINDEAGSWGNIVIVHGHTPVYYQRGHETLNEILNNLYPEVYADGYKINIDMGTYNTHACVLLNLDTFEHHLFTIEG